MRRPIIYLGNLALVIAVGILAQVLQLIPLHMQPWWPWLWGGAAIVIGLVWLIGPRTMYPFSVPLKDTQFGELMIYGGAVDVRVGKTLRESLLVGQTSLPDGPQRNNLTGNTTQITARNQWYHLLNFRDWQLYLHPEVSWKLTIENNLGNVFADLRDLQMRQVSMVTDLGDVQVTTPSQGTTSLYVSTTSGDIAIRVSEGIVADMRIDAGPKSRIRMDTDRFAIGEDGTWRSIEHDETAENRLMLTVETTSGDVTVI